MRKESLPFHKPDIGPEEERLVLQALRSGWLTTGPLTEEFEKKFAELIGVRHAVAFSSCTAAMHVALSAWDIGPGDEVITTPFTFCATVEVIEYVGATPVLVDIERSTGNINPELIESAVNEKTKAIIPVHYAGLPCEMAAVQSVAKANDVLVLEDSALAAGSFIDGAYVGAKYSDAAAFSFYATKNICTGEGGMLVCNDSKFADRCRKLSLHGMNRDSWKRYSSKGSWHYEINALGFKYNFTDLTAALGLAQLEKFDAGNRKRQKIAGQYIESFGNLDFLEPFQWDIPEHVTHNRHLFPIILKSELLSITREQFIQKLSDRNIGVSVHYIPVHFHSYFNKKYGWKAGDFPQTEDLFSRVVTLPIYPGMSEKDVSDVITAVSEIGKENHT